MQCISASTAVSTACITGGGDLDRDRPSGSTASDPTLVQDQSFFLLFHDLTSSSPSVVQSPTECPGGSEDLGRGRREKRQKKKSEFDKPAYCENRTLGVHGVLDESSGGYDMAGLKRTWSSHLATHSVFGPFSLPFPCFFFFFFFFGLPCPPFFQQIYFFFFFFFLLVY